MSGGGEWVESLQDDQRGVLDARRDLDDAMAHRDDQVQSAHADGMTIYRIAKTLGVTQGAVRRMLGL